MIKSELWSKFYDIPCMQDLGYLLDITMDDETSLHNYLSLYKKEVNVSDIMGLSEHMDKSEGIKFASYYIAASKYIITEEDIIDYVMRSLSANVCQFIKSVDWGRQYDMNKFYKHIIENHKEVFENNIGYMRIFLEKLGSVCDTFVEHSLELTEYIDKICKNEPSWLFSEMYTYLTSVDIYGEYKGELDDCRAYTILKALDI